MAAGKHDLCNENKMMIMITILARKTGELGMLLITEY